MSELHAQLERANARVAELMAQLAAEESARGDLERTRRALHAAQTNVALGLMGKNFAPAAARDVPPPPRYPIAAPRHQFGPQYAHARAGRTTPTTAGGSGRASSTPRTRAPAR